MSEPPKFPPLSRLRDAGRRPLRDIGKIDIHQVIPDPDQPRQEFSQESLTRLSQSIRNQGQLNPIRVRWKDELGKWVIISGERRWRASLLAGLTTIDCHFQEGDLTKSEILEQQLIENCLREDLTPIEEAKAYAALIHLNQWTGKQLADALQVPATRISRALALLKLPSDIQQQVDAGRIAARSAYELSKLADDHARRVLAGRAAAGVLTHDQARDAVRRRQGRAQHKPRMTKQVFSTEAGWKVIVSASKKGTYFEIEQALILALEEVRHRINNNVQLF